MCKFYSTQLYICNVVYFVGTWCSVKKPAKLCRIQDKMNAFTVIHRYWLFTWTKDLVCRTCEGSKHPALNPTWHACDPSASNCNYNFSNMIFLMQMWLALDMNLPELCATPLGDEIKGKSQSIFNQIWCLGLNVIG